MVGLFFSFVFLIGRRDEDAAYPPLRTRRCFTPSDILHFSFLGEEKKIELKHRGQNVQKKNVHPVFEKLEFYLNLKNDFALTFIRDERRVYFFSKKKSPNVNEA